MIVNENIIIAVECPRCYVAGHISVPTNNMNSMAFARCTSCGLVYDESYFADEYLAGRLEANLAGANNG